MDAEEVGLGVEETPCFDYLVRVQVVFLSEPGCGELAAVVPDPVIKGRDGYFRPESSAHCSRGHIKGVALVVVCEGREDELRWVGGVGENAVGEAILATFT